MQKVACLLFCPILLFSVSPAPGRKTSVYSDAKSIHCCCLANATGCGDFLPGGLYLVHSDGNCSEDRYLKLRKYERVFNAMYTLMPEGPVTAGILFITEPAKKLPSTHRLFSCYRDPP
jgi:hypothetical protein